MGWGWVRVISLALALSCAAPVFAQQTGGADTAQITAEMAAEDAAILARVQAILGELDDYENVQAKVHAGVVTFTGEVLEGEVDGVRFGVEPFLPS